MLLNASSSALTIGSSVSSIATVATIVDIPVSAGLGGVALASSISVGLVTALVKKYQKKLNKVMKLYNIATSATAVFETSTSQALNDGKIDLKEFQLLQGTYYKALEKLSSTDREMAVETRGQFEKFIGRTSKHKMLHNVCLYTVCLFYVLQQKLSFINKKC